MFSESFVLISLLKMCQEWGVLQGGTWRMLRVPDRRLILPQGRYPESFMLLSLLEVCQEWGALHEGTWRTLRVPEWRLGVHDHP